MLRGSAKGTSKHVCAHVLMCCVRHYPHARTTVHVHVRVGGVHSTVQQQVKRTVLGDMLRWAKQKRALREHAEITLPVHTSPCEGVQHMFALDCSYRRSSTASPAGSGMPSMCEIIRSLMHARRRICVDSSARWGGSCTCPTLLIFICGRIFHICISQISYCAADERASAALAN